MNFDLYKYSASNNQIKYSLEYTYKWSVGHNYTTCTDVVLFDIFNCTKTKSTIQRFNSKYNRVWEQNALLTEARHD